MKNIIKKTIWISLLILPSSVFAWTLMDLWQTPDQQAAKLLQAGKPQEASQLFENKEWQAVSHYRSGNYTQAFKQFNAKKTSDDQYNAGNAAAFMGQYQAALNAYDKAITLNPKNTDAVTNREIIKKLMAKKNPPQNNSSDKNDKNNNQNNNQNNKENGNSSSSQQNMSQNNSSSKDNSEKENNQNNAQKNNNNNAKKQENNSQQEQINQMSEKQKLDSGQQNQEHLTSSNLKTQDENQKQLMRRLADDPGGLLRQKFLRDYFRRHMNNGNADQGEN